MLIVFLLWVMRTNWVCTLISFTSSVKRPMLASSSGASTSSRMQNGLGWYWKMPTSSASAVIAFSPPESRSTFCRRLPGGEAITSMPLSSLFSRSVRRIMPWPPPNSFLKLLPREDVNFLDRRRGVLDRLDQVFALYFQEVMTLRGFLIFFKGHHVDRAHGVEASAHFLSRLLFRGKLVAGDTRQGFVSHQVGTLDTEIIDAGLR